jgi:hypothetical protein
MNMIGDTVNLQRDAAKAAYSASQIFMQART